MLRRGGGGGERQDVRLNAGGGEWRRLVGGGERRRLVGGGGERRALLREPLNDDCLRVLADSP